MSRPDAARDTTARTRVHDYLGQHGPVVDENGHATRVLRQAVGYAGTSSAFVQVILAMSQAGELDRDVRGKKTYRISSKGDPRRRAAGAPPQGADNPRLGSPADVPEGTVTVPVDVEKLAVALVWACLDRLTSTVSPPGSET